MDEVGNLEAIQPDVSNPLQLLRRSDVKFMHPFVPAARHVKSYLGSDLRDARHFRHRCADRRRALTMGAAQVNSSTFPSTIIAYDVTVSVCSPSGYWPPGSGRTRLTAVSLYTSGLSCSMR